MKGSLLLLFFGFAAMLQANDTAIHSGDTGPEPVGWLTGEESIIQMVSEHLQIRFGKEHADVVARFTFRSHKTSGVARQTLGFPEYYQISEYGETVGPLTNMRTYVDGHRVPTRLKRGYVSMQDDRRKIVWSRSNEGDEATGWYLVDVEFPPRKDVVVERRYRTPLGVTAGGPWFFNYRTFTGGNWHGRIKRLVADIELVDGLTLKDVAVRGGNESWWGPEGAGRHGPARRVDDRHLRLVWGNFEPRNDTRRQEFSIQWWDAQQRAHWEKYGSSGQKKKGLSRLLRPGRR